MGYRSDVYCEIKKADKTAEEIIKEVKTGLESKNDNLNLFDEIYKKDNAVIFIAKYIKWYEDVYESVQWFMNYIYSLGEEIDNNPHKFDSVEFIHYIRIGESLEDFEERCFGDISFTDLHITRTVEVDV